MFELIVDEKVETWRRSYITVEADSLEEAVKKCIKEGSDCGNILESDYIYECDERVTPKYEGDITIEVMDRSYNTLGNDSGSI